MVATMNAKLKDLTERQRAVLDLLDDELTVTQIAKELGVTRNAVYGQIKTLRAKGALPEGYTASGRPPRETGTFARSDSPVILALLEEVREAADSLAEVEARLRSLTR